MQMWWTVCNKISCSRISWVIFWLDCLFDKKSFSLSAIIMFWKVSLWFHFKKSYSKMNDTYHVTWKEVLQLGWLQVTHAPYDASIAVLHRMHFFLNSSGCRPSRIIGSIKVLSPKVISGKKSPQITWAHFLFPVGLKPPKVEGHSSHFWI